jgi:hypothetical protein
MSKKSFSNYALDFALPLALAACEAMDDQAFALDARPVVHCCIQRRCDEGPWRGFSEDHFL